MVFERACCDRVRETTGHLGEEESKQEERDEESSSGMWWEQD
jgi:hypothetical protein